MEQQMDTELGMTPVSPETQWGPDAPKGARAVFSRIIKEGANVPLFVGQTMINALRDLGYNNTTSAICEHVDNSFQWRGQDVRLYFHEKGKRKDVRKIDVLVLDNGVGMSPNVLRAVTAFGGSLCYDNRETVGKYGMGMKAAALSMGPVLEIYSWQEPGAIYRMILDTVDLSNKNTNVVQLPEPVLVDTLPPEVREILVQPMGFPKNAAEQEILAESDEVLMERLGSSGTIVYIPDCDRLTHRTAKTLVDHATKEMARIYRRFLKDGRNLFINNRRVRPFDPTYRMEEATHASIAELGEKRSRLVQSWTIPIPVEDLVRKRYYSLRRNRLSKLNNRRALDRLRCRGTHRRCGSDIGSVLLMAPARDVVDQIAYGQLTDLIRTVLPDDDFMFLLDAADGEAYADMARDRNMTVSGVKSKAFRVREKVRNSAISATLRHGLRR
ncbi:MAG: ATP-binding protein [Candidatus Sulfotelmatobacter sp.]